MTDGQIKDLLERLLQTQVLGKAYKRSSEAKREMDMSARALTDLIDLRKSIIADIEERVAKFAESKASFLNRQKVKIKEVKSSIETQKKEIDDLERVCAVDQQQLIDDLKEQLSNLEEEDMANALAMTNLYSDTNSKVVEIDAQLAKYESLIKDLEDKIEHTNNLGPSCSHCGQDISKDHTDAVVADLHDQSQKLLLEKIDYNFARVTAFQDLKNDLEPLQAQKEVLKVRKDILQRAMSDASFKQAENSAAKKSLEAAKERLASLEQNLEAVQQETNPFTSLLDTEVSNGQAAVSEVCAKMKDLNTTQHKAALYDFWVKGFSPAGLRSFMLEHVTPILNASAAKYADILTDGEMNVTFHTKQTLKSGKETEKFNVSVSQRHGGSSYASNSSGERARGNLVAALALGDLAAMRARKSLPFRFLDEPFESVDESGTEAIVRLLNMQKEEYGTVFVITHQDHFKQMFPTKITVVKKNGQSTISR